MFKGRLIGDRLPGPCKKSRSTIKKELFVCVCYMFYFLFCSADFICSQLLENTFFNCCCACFSFSWLKKFIFDLLWSDYIMCSNWFINLFLSKAIDFDIFTLVNWMLVNPSAKSSRNKSDKVQMMNGAIVSFLVNCYRNSTHKLRQQCIFLVSPKK